MPGSGTARDRDIAAFGERAQRYDQGWRGRLHHQIADRTADLALSRVPAPRRILDVGCGTGYLLGQLASRAPQAEVLAGIDAAPAMIEVARVAAADDRLRFVVGTAERPTCSRCCCVPTLLAGRRGKARTRRRAALLVTAAGLHAPQWRRLYAVIIQAVTATK
jgi:SAM-dependent methyltransferase